MQGREEVNIYLNTLRFAESVGHSTVLHTSGGEVRVYLPLSSFFGQLEGEPDFLMCGRSYIANLSAVESFDAGFRGTHLPGRRIAHSSGQAAPLRKGADEVRGKIGGLICTLFSAASTLWCS